MTPQAKATPDMSLKISVSAKATQLTQTNKPANQPRIAQYVLDQKNNSIDRISRPNRTCPIRHPSCFALAGTCSTYFVYAR